ncbi:unnamed protein product [Strongylus vulgaris]|uniref:Uncharacterized protein n=1 Tax=Strongylus vulgaris TaxID=40348 RepID=A0A3P7I0V3_STRVU|nr:unnamed protein product [Strongylus vulgaris]
MCYCVHIVSGFNVVLRGVELKDWMVHEHKNAVNCGNSHDRHLIPAHRVSLFSIWKDTIKGLGDTIRIEKRLFGMFIPLEEHIVRFLCCGIEYR